MNYKVKNGILIAPKEIFLKSAGVQHYLRHKLADNAFYFLKKAGINFVIHILHQRIFVETDDTKRSINVTKNLFGVAWFAKAFCINGTKLSFIEDFVKNHYSEWILKNETFAIEIRKSIGMKQTRQEIIELIAQHIDRKVNLNNPDKKLVIELRKNMLLLYFEKIAGQGGLPGESQGKILSMISGGIDSPVAAYLMARRGCENIWIHFHSFPLVSRASIQKINDLGNVFLKYQKKLSICFVPFSDIQMLIKTNAPANYRVLLYKSAMFHISEIVAWNMQCLGIVTGDSLGQVSSQTLCNINVTQSNITLPIFRPLIEMDKDSISKISQDIGMFNISIRKQEDTCTLFVSKQQTADGKIKVLKKIEEQLGINKAIDKVIKKIEYTQLV